MMLTGFVTCSASFDGSLKMFPKESQHAAKWSYGLNISNRMVEIYSKSLVGAIGKVLIMKFS